MKKSIIRYLVVIEMLSASFALFGQSDSLTEPFKPVFKPMVNVFGNLHHDFAENPKPNSGFELTRTYIGGDYILNKEISGRFILDAGNPGNSDLEHDVYVRNVFIKYAKNKFTFDFGIISTKQVAVQEKFWGHRYVYKSFQDENKFCYTADMGVSATYDVNSFISLDVIVINGEGYKKMQSDDVYRSGYGITLTPLKGLTIRGYYDHYEKAVAQSTIASFIGYKNKLFSLGGEYNTQTNFGFKKDYTYIGYSVYGQVNLSKKNELFARYDLLDGELPMLVPTVNKSVLIAGFQRKLYDFLTASVNYQETDYQVDNSLPKHLVYLNFDLKF